MFWTNCFNSGGLSSINSSSNESVKGQLDRSPGEMAATLCLKEAIRAEASTSSLPIEASIASAR